MRRALLHLLLLAMLALSQEGALVHEIGHRLVAGSTRSHDQGKVPEEKVCRLCVAYAQLGGAVLATPQAMLLLALAFHHGLTVAPPAILAERIAPRSRGPPASA